MRNATDTSRGHTMTDEELGKIMLRTWGTDICEQAYDSTDPVTIGQMALGFRDINRDGTLN